MYDTFFLQCNSEMNVKVQLLEGSRKMTKTLEEAYHGYVSTCMCNNVCKISDAALHQALALLLT